MNSNFKTVDEYIRSQPPDVQKVLLKIRKTIIEAAPKAREVISYKMPAYKLGKGRPIVYFAAFKNHIGFFPLPKAIEVFKDDVKDYKTSKGTVQFPLDKPIPLNLIEKIISFNVKEKEGLTE